MGRRSWPLVGRTEEFRQVRDALRRADGARGVLLSGEAGIGKTRLVREVLAAEARRGVATRWAAATPTTRRLPLSVFGTVSPQTGGDATQVLQRTTEALLAGTKDADVVVGVDDAHLLDELSALLVHRLVVNRAASVVLTVRAGEVAPDTVTALWKDDLVDRLDLQPLPQARAFELLETVLGGPVDTAGAARIWSLTRGNALFLRHLLDGELDAGRLREVDGVWCWTRKETGAEAYPPGLVELIMAQVGDLSAPVREVVDVLTVGEPLGLTVLDRLVPPAAVEQAETAGLVSVEQDGRRLQARLAHPLYGEVWRRGIGRLRARRLRGRVASAIADTGARRGDDTLRVAVLAMDSDLDQDPELLHAGARKAFQLGAVPLAEQLSGAAISAGGDFAAHVTHAYALTWLSKGEECEAALAGMESMASSDVERLRVTIPRVGNLFWILRRPVAAEAVLDAVEENGVTDRGVRVSFTSMRASFHAFRGRPADAVRAAREVLHSPLATDQAVIQATWGLVLGLGLLGRTGELGDAAERAYATSMQLDNGVALRFGLSDLHMTVLRLAGRLDEVDRIACDRRRDSADVPGPARAMGAALLGHAALARGRLGPAVRWLREARATLPDDIGGWRFRCQLSLTEALAIAGHLPDARSALATLEEERHPSFTFLAPEMLLARAWVAAAEGAQSVAVELCHDAAATATGLDQVAHEMLALHTAVCLGDDTPAARLAELADTVEGPRATAAAAHAAALASGDGVALLAASAELERMGDLVAAADAAAQAVGALDQRGRKGSSRAAALRALRLAAACEESRTPAVRGAARPLPLTAREREIVTLASGGLSNREIADRLVVAVRTVEGHLYRASAKLGTASRTELAARLRGE